GDRPLVELAPHRGQPRFDPDGLVRLDPTLAHSDWYRVVVTDQVDARQPWPLEANQLVGARHEVEGQRTWPAQCDTLQLERLDVALHAQLEPRQPLDHRF